MSYHPRAGNCKNVAYIGEHNRVLADHEEIVNETSDKKLKKHPEILMLNGWRLYRGDGNPYKGDELCPESYIGPNGEVVHVLNSSEYSMVDEHDWVVFGPNKDHVRMFLEACGIKDVNIRAKAIVKQMV